MLRLRVCVADRPGALGRLTTTLGQLGADVLQVSVLARESGRAWDDLVVGWPQRRPMADLHAALAALPGVQVDGIWPTRDTPDAHPALDVLTQVAGDPARGLTTVVDALPGVASAAWAAASPAEDPLGWVRSVGAPSDEPGPVFAEVVKQTAVHRPITRSIDGQHIVVLPMPSGTATILVVRNAGASFHPVEVERLMRLLTCVDALVQTLVPSTSRGPTRQPV